MTNLGRNLDKTGNCGIIWTQLITQWFGGGEGRGAGPSKPHQLRPTFVMFVFVVISSGGGGEAWRAANQGAPPIIRQEAGEPPLLSPSSLPLLQYSLVLFHVIVQISLFVK